MPAATAHKVSASNHKLYHEALRLTTIYVYLDLTYATLLLAAALHLSGVPLGLILGLDVPLKKSEAGGEGGLVRSGALSLATAGVMGLLVGVMVRGCCRLDKSKGCVVTNWHDLLKYTHMGRTITAAMCGVQATPRQPYRLDMARARLLEGLPDPGEWGRTSPSRAHHRRGLELGGSSVHELPALQNEGRADGVRQAQAHMTHAGHRWR
ncbi:unnamed protein product [Ectocarpus sp. 13 AM-2016]